LLGLSPESWVVRVDRVRCANGIPIALEKAVLLGEAEPVLKFDLERGSLQAALASLGRRLGRATGYVTARLASVEEAQLLDLSMPAALLVETRLITDVNGRPVESTETAYVGSRWVIDTGAFVPSPARSGANRGELSDGSSAD